MLSNEGDNRYRFIDSKLSASLESMPKMKRKRMIQAVLDYAKILIEIADSHDENREW